MDDALIDRLIDEMADFDLPFYFAPFKVNEPLLDRRLYDICEKVAKTEAWIRIFTNGAALTDRHIERLAGLKKIVHLWVSLNSHKPDEYEALMRMPFERTAKRLDALHEADFPHDVVLSCVGAPNKAFELYCNNRWPDFDVFVMKRDSWLGFTEAQNLDVPDRFCSRWFEMSILSSGIVSLCCMDGEGKYPLGDLNKMSLLDVYNQPHLLERRKKLLSRHEVDPCRTCTY